MGLRVAGLMLVMLWMPSAIAAPYLAYEVKAVYDHDTSAFTQGLVYDDGIFYESTGLYGRSSVRQVKPLTGEVILKRRVSKRYFAEGLAKVDDQLYLLSWQAGRAWRYQADNLKPEKAFTYKGEGWGLAYDGQHLIMSDGSDTLQWRDVDTFDLVKTLAVTDQGKAVSFLNELEYVDGWIVANVWQSDELVMINAENGQVEYRVDLALLNPHQGDVMNGIAYNPELDQWYVTGKEWPVLYAIRFPQWQLAPKQKSVE